MEKVLAGLLLAVCVVLFLRLLAGASRRQRFDAWARHAAATLAQRTRRIRHWRASRDEARRVADEAIRRARGEAGDDVERDGNVYRPRSFKKPPRDKMH